MKNLIYIVLFFIFFGVIAAVVVNFITSKKQDVDVSIYQDSIKTLKIHRAILLEMQSKNARKIDSLKNKIDGISLMYKDYKKKDSVEIIRLKSIKSKIPKSADEIKTVMDSLYNAIGN